MGYQIIEPCKDPIYLDFMEHKVSHASPTALAKSGKYKKFYKCSGLWNRGCRECTLDELLRMIDWMATGDCYESSDGTALFIHGYSESDMW